MHNGHVLAFYWHRLQVSFFGMADWNAKAAAYRAEVTRMMESA